MPAPAQPKLEPGRVYRTGDLSAWGSNPTRLAHRLVAQGRLRRLRQGLYEAPALSRFGLIPATDVELVRAFIGTDEFLFSGSLAWNALGLGATAVQAVTLVYNRRRSGEFTFGRRRFVFRRVAFPSTTPAPEWYAIDLYRHAAEAGVDRADVLAGMGAAVNSGSLNGAMLLDMAGRFGRPGTVSAVAGAIAQEPGSC